MIKKLAIFIAFSCVTSVCAESVTVGKSNGDVIVTINSGIQLSVKDEGTFVAEVSTINCVGGDISCTDGGSGIVNIAVSSLTSIFSTTNTWTASQYFSSSSINGHFTLRHQDRVRWGDGNTFIQGDTEDPNPDFIRFLVDGEINAEIFKNDFRFQKLVNLNNLTSIVNSTGLEIGGIQFTTYMDTVATAIDLRISNTAGVVFSTMIADHIVNANMTINIDSGTFVSSMTTTWISFSSAVINGLSYVFQSTAQESGNNVLQRNADGIIIFGGDGGGDGAGGGGGGVDFFGGSGFVGVSTLSVPGIVTLSGGGHTTYFVLRSSPRWTGEQTFTAHSSFSALVDFSSQVVFTLGTSDFFIIDGETNFRSIDGPILEIKHRAQTNATRALLIDVEANGFANTHAFHIDYHASGFDSSFAEDIIELIAVSSSSTGGTLHGININKIGTGTVKVIGMRVGVNVEPIEHHSGEFVSLDGGFAWDGVSDATYVTTISSYNVDNSTGNVKVWENDLDYVVIGSSIVFDSIELLFEVAPTKELGLTFEFSTGSHLGEDGFGGRLSFTPDSDIEAGSDEGLVKFESDDLVALGWSTQTVRGVHDEFWIWIQRHRTGNIGAPTERIIRTDAGDVEFGWDAKGDVVINSLAIGLDTATAAIELKDSSMTIRGTGADLGIGNISYNNYRATTTDRLDEFEVFVATAQDKIPAHVNFLSTHSIRIDEIQADLSTHSVRVDELQVHVATAAPQILAVNNFLSTHSIRIDEIQADLSTHSVRVDELQVFASTGQNAIHNTAGIIFSTMIADHLDNTAGTIDYASATFTTGALLGAATVQAQLTIDEGTITINGITYVWKGVAPTDDQVLTFDNGNGLIGWETPAAGGGGGGGGGAVYDGTVTAFSTFSIQTPFELAQTADGNNHSTFTVLGATLPVVSYSFPAGSWKGINPNKANEDDSNIAVTSDTLRYDIASWDYFEFKDSTRSFKGLQFRLVPGYDGSTVAFTYDWYAGSGTNNNNVRFCMDCVAISSGTSMLSVVGTSVCVTSTFKAINQNAQSAQSASLTIAGNPEGGDLAVIRFFRDPVDGRDNLDSFAYVTNVDLSHKRNRFSDKNEIQVP